MAFVHTVTAIYTTIKCQLQPFQTHWLVLGCASYKMGIAMHFLVTIKLQQSLASCVLFLPLPVTFVAQENVRPISQIPFVAST